MLNPDPTPLTGKVGGGPGGINIGATAALLALTSDLWLLASIFRLRA